MRNPNRTANKRRAENEENVRPDTLIVANSRYGSSNQYTQWLIDRLGADAMSYNKQQLGYTSLYRNIIWVGAIRDAVISNVHMLWQNHHNFGLDGKKIIICGVGIGEQAAEQAQAHRQTAVRQVPHRLKEDIRRRDSSAGQ